MLSVNDELQQRLSQIKLLALDVDGVLTDGSINMGNEGELFKAFNAKDGLGISLALRHDLQVAIITGRKSQIIHNRLNELGVKLLFEGIKDKAGVLKNLGVSLELTEENIAFMGDDLNDLPAMSVSGLAIAPSDACDDVLEYADFVTKHAGGRGAVRDAIELVLKAQGKWQQIIQEYKLSGQGDEQ